MVNGWQTSDLKATNFAIGADYRNNRREKTMKNKAVGFCGLLNNALIVLKIFSVITWSWLIVIPLIIVIAAIPWILRIAFIYWLNK